MRVIFAHSKVTDLSKTRVAAVSYLNTKPLLYGIRHHPILSEIELIEDYPSRIATMLIEDEADIGLVPVAAIPQILNGHIITDYCIGCDGAVASVCLFSAVPIEQIETVYLDYQSRTSVVLAKILLNEYWKQKVSFLNAVDEYFRGKVTGTTAAVVIGDRALTQREAVSFVYDLGEAWKAYTGLPFVFAAWVANKPLPSRFIEQFNEANALGLQSLNKVIEENKSSGVDLEQYYKKSIQYNLDLAKRSGMQLFLDKLNGTN